MYGLRNLRRPNSEGATRDAYVSPSGNVKIDWAFNQELGYSVAIFKKSGKARDVPFLEPEHRNETLGLSNIPERKFRWMGDRYCITTISSGFGILDTEQAKWVCNIDVVLGYAQIRNTIAYVAFRPGRGDPKPGDKDTIGVYRFLGQGNDRQLEHKVHPLPGHVISPIFESRYQENVAFILQLPSKQKELVIFGTDTGKPLATRLLPKRFASRKTLWADDIKKVGRQQNRELLEWIDSATKYGPFWEPQADRF